MKKSEKKEKSLQILGSSSFINDSSDKAAFIYDQEGDTKKDLRFSATKVVPSYALKDLMEHEEVQEELEQGTLITLTNTIEIRPSHYNDDVEAALIFIEKLKDFGYPGQIQVQNSSKYPKELREAINEFNINYMTQHLEENAVLTGPEIHVDASVLIQRPDLTFNTEVLYVTAKGLENSTAKDTSDINPVGVLATTIDNLLRYNKVSLLPEGKHGIIKPQIVISGFENLEYDINLVNSLTFIELGNDIIFEKAMENNIEIVLDHKLTTLLANTPDLAVVNFQYKTQRAITRDPDTGQIYLREEDGARENLQNEAYENPHLLLNDYAKYYGEGPMLFHQALQNACDDREVSLGKDGNDNEITKPLYSSFSPGFVKTLRDFYYTAEMKDGESSRNASAKAIMDIKERKLTALISELTKEYAESVHQHAYRRQLEQEKIAEYQDGYNPEHDNYPKHQSNPSPYYIENDILTIADRKDVEQQVQNAEFNDLTVVHDQDYIAYLEHNLTPVLKEYNDKSKEFGQKILENKYAYSSLFSLLITVGPVAGYLGCAYLASPEIFGAAAAQAITFLTETFMSAFANPMVSYETMQCAAIATSAATGVIVAAAVVALLAAVVIPALMNLAREVEVGTIQTPEVSITDDVLDKVVRNSELESYKSENRNTGHIER